MVAMAILSLIQWSYGVCCWEIFSGGEIPYPGVHPDTIIHHLKRGERLSKPLNSACTDEMLVARLGRQFTQSLYFRYQLMVSCWNACDKQRPTFSELVGIVETQLETVAKYLHINT